MPRRGFEETSVDVSFTDDEALPPGIVFTDTIQNKWRIGKPIGRGSFGRIYLASDDSEKEVTKLNARYVVKIEPHTNGPLFVEVHCLIRTAQVNEVKAWRHQNKRKRLGMPIYIASGSFTHESTGIKYRFLVLPRYDVDLQKIISKTKVLDLRNVLVIAIQILDVLEYFHSKGYTHSDIKSSNLMLGFDGNKYNKGLIKPTQSFQKDNKQIVLLTKKHRKSKSSKTRVSNYYEDEDYKARERSSTDAQEDSDKHLATVKKKLRKILSDKDSRSLHRHHAFNLRQLSSYVNYEDLNSSVCSDQSYQNFLDDFGHYYSPKKVYNDKTILDKSCTEHTDEIHKEAVLYQSNGQIYLLDYGLASKFLDSKGDHKVFAMDARKAHDGTLEYSSRDSHVGAHSRRSDLETLGYNLLDWLTGTLPWKTSEVLAEPDLVHILKKNFMNDTKLLLKTCFKTEFYPQFLEKYLQYIKSLDFTDKPDYDYCRSLFRGELLKNGYVLDKELNVNFAEAPMSPMRSKCYTKRFGRKNTPQDFIARNGIKKAYERENLCSLENDLKLELLKQTLNTSSEGIRKPCASRNFFISDADLVARLKKSLMPHDVFGKKLSPKNLRSKKKTTVPKRKGVRRHRNSIGKFGKFMGSAKQFTWAEILARNPEDIIRKERNPVTGHEEEDDDSNCKYRIRKLSNASENSDTQSPILQKEYLHDKNPTYAMKEVIANLNKRINSKTTKETDEGHPQLEGYTPAMMTYYLIKQKREAKEKLESQIKQQCVKEVTVRCTRSMRNKSNNSEPRSTSTKRKVTNTKDIDEKNIENTVQVTPRKSNRKTKGKGTPKTELKTVESPNNTTKTKKTPRKSTVTVNRRRLRSSKRRKS
ncbi:uncharacterized protein LOC120634812 [Pararge aegeria]|nr:uncharacterized protein LOC120634812 [Pararge aegeria]XP_039761559.1 uncharacterized protein LOC120634812 [Pararge aegeria]XP_039761560.1 uncharacterized protein LOC120634812 [Pararge aegeria]